MENGKIVPSRITGTKATYQRKLTRAIKLARCLALFYLTGINKTMWQTIYKLLLRHRTLSVVLTFVISCTVVGIIGVLYAALVTLVRGALEGDYSLQRHCLISLPSWQQDLKMAHAHCRVGCCFSSVISNTDMDILSHVT